MRVEFCVYHNIYTAYTNWFTKKNVFENILENKRTQTTKCF